MADSEEMVHTTDEMKSEIVCPVCLKIAVASAEQSDGKLGAIQSYRCSPRPNSGGWETRPQKGDKWSADFFSVINAEAGEEVTLSDGVTKVKGFDWNGKPSDTRFRFTHEDGVKSKEYAIRYVKAGKLRAPRNWDRTFSEQAGITLDELKSTYPEVYQAATRASTSKQTEDEPEINSLGSGFFGDEGSKESVLETEGESQVEAEHLDEEDDALIAQEETAYSVTAEEELADNGVINPDEFNPMEIRHTTPTIVLHADAMAFRASMGDEYMTFIKVVDPLTGEWVWVHEGQNEDLSHITVKFV